MYRLYCGDTYFPIVHHINTNSNVFGAIYLPYNRSYMRHEYCKQYAYENDKTIKCYDM